MLVLISTFLWVMYSSNIKLTFGTGDCQLFRQKLGHQLVYLKVPYKASPSIAMLVCSFQEKVHEFLH